VTVLVDGDGRMSEDGVLQAVAGREPDRTMARGIIVVDKFVLLVHSRLTGLWGTPGGRVHPGEDFEECFRRQMAEETGYVIEPISCPVEVYEDVNGMLFRARYYTGQISGSCTESMNPTEIAWEQVPVWCTVARAQEEVEHGIQVYRKRWYDGYGNLKPAYAPFASTLSHAGSIYRRELAALDTLWRLGMLGNGGATDTEEGMS
jgi:8-oxo-dGTP pyrophosphatase MutT (NUDIX family)